MNTNEIMSAESSATTATLRMVVAITSKVVELILAILETSTPSEIVFSSAAIIVDKKRSGLSQKMLIYLCVFEGKDGLCRLSITTF